MSFIKKDVSGMRASASSADTEEIYVDDLSSLGASKSSEQSFLPQSRRSRNLQVSNISGHRMHRSSVRPFFCCGSQLSLNSITDFMDSPDTSDCDDATDLMANLSIKRSQTRRKKNDIHEKGRKKFWTLKLRGKLHVPKRSQYSTSDGGATGGIVCTSFTRKSDDTSIEQPSTSGLNSSQEQQEVFVTLRPINFDELYPTEDIDQRRIAQRAREMEEGIDVQDACIWIPQAGDSSSEEEYESPQLNLSAEAPVSESFYNEYSFPMMATALSAHSEMMTPVRPHSQVEYIHCLVPDIAKITNCSYYWGVMDRYQAERLLDKKPEGTFLLRDSAQEEYLFSVSFRRYGRSLHARIEQWNHKFSFDSHDPGVFASDTVCGLIEHYKDASCCMFFEPMLTSPLHRSFPFSLQHLCRSIICDRINYDGINLLPLPRTLRDYMRYYHYRQKIRMRRFDMSV